MHGPLDAGVRDKKHLLDALSFTLFSNLLHSDFLAIF
jgi:hypothetical protein